MTHRTKLYTELVCRYEREFAEHQLLRCDEIEPHRAVIRIGRPGECFFLTEIAISLRHVVLWGDVSTVAFMGGDGGPWRSQLAWLGAGRADFEYCASKACIGTGREIAYSIDEDIAKSDIIDARRTDSVSAEQAREAFDALRRGDDVRVVRQMLYDAGADWEIAGDVGEVVSPAVLCAVAALRAAHRLVNQ